MEVGNSRDTAVTPGVINPERHACFSSGQIPSSLRLNRLFKYCPVELARCSSKVTGLAAFTIIGSNWAYPAARGA